MEAEHLVIGVLSGVSILGPESERGAQTGAALEPQVCQLATRCQVIGESTGQGMVVQVPVATFTIVMSPEPSPPISRIDAPSGDQSQLTKPFVCTGPRSRRSPVARSRM